MTGHQPELFNWFSEISNDTHLSAINHIDLCEIDQSGIAMGRTVIEKLLKSSELHLSLKTSSETDRKLFHTFIDHKNTVSHNSFHGLGLGFPIIRLNNKKTKEVCLAPLFIWNIHLEYTTTLNPTWKISHSQEDPIRLNNTLYNYIKNNYKVDLSKLSHPLLSKKNLTAISLSKICYELSSALGKKEDFFVENIKRISTKTDSNILCAGVIGNFKEVLQLPKIKASKNSKQASEIRHPFSTSILDPWQNKAFQKFHHQTNTQIISESGTGKSHLLHYSLVNALSNGLKSIVIADSMDRIKKIRNEMSANGLDHLVLDITNPEKDHSKIVEALSFKSSLPKEDYDLGYFNYLLNLAHRHQDRLDTSFRILSQPVFDKTNWSQVVGNYLKYKRVERQELLDNQLNAKDFTFHPTEYLSLKEAVNISESLYSKIGTLKHPLGILHPDIFLEKTKQEAQEFIGLKLDQFYKKFDNLHHRYILKQQDYAKDLSNTRTSFYQDALIKIEELKDHIEDNRLLYGNEFEDSGLIQTGRLKVYGVFSGKHKNILQARNSINEQFKDLRIFMNQQVENGFEIIDNIDTKSISKVSAHLNNLEDQLYRWNDSIADQLQEELQRLNTKSVDDNLDYGEQINELEFTLDLNIEELNAAGLFHLAKENKMLTIPMRQHFIQEILEQIKTTQNQLRDFSEFYDWQRHWLLLPEIHRKLLTAIIKVNPKNWKIAFQSWYFYQRLKADFHFKTPKNIDGLLAFERDIQKLQEIIPKQIRHLWKQKSIKRKSAKQLSKLPFLDFFDTHFELITQEFPVIVVTHPVAAQIFNQQTYDFDLGFIFSNQLDHSNDDYSLVSLAKHNVIFTPLSNKEQVLNTSNNSLNFIHKNIPASNFDFVNKVIHRQQKNLSSSISQTLPSFKVVQSNGQFHQNINTKEADQIIEDLLKLEKESKQNFPSTAVISSTPEQRNYIARKIIENPERKDLSKLVAAKKISFFHIQETRSNTYKHIFFSLGIHSFTHTSNEFLSFLNSKNGYRNLEQLLCSNVSLFHIYHSLSENDITNYLTYKTKKSTRILASWIKYALANASNNKADQISILDSFPSDAPEYNNQLIQEIANELAPFIGKNRILQNTNLLGIQLPLVILPSQDNGNYISILCDACLDNSAKSHLWNLSLIRQLNNQGVNTIPVWSANWFENPALEARRLASSILKQDKT